MGQRGPSVIAEYKRDPLKTGMISWTAHKLKRLTIPKLRYCKALEISVADAGSNAKLTTAVTDGKEMQFNPVAVAEFILVSDGVHPVTIQFRDPQSEKGIWLNAFALSAWHENLLRFRRARPDGATTD